MSVRKSFRTSLAWFGLLSGFPQENLEHSSGGNEGVSSITRVSIPMNGTVINVEMKVSWSVNAKKYNCQHF